MSSNLELNMKACSVKIGKKNKGDMWHVVSDWVSVTEPVSETEYQCDIYIRVPLYT